jgi:putative two-component system response regulator
VVAAPGLQTAAGVAAVVVGVLAAFVAIRLTGGSPNPWNHLGYAPIVLAAYLYGMRGAVPTAVGVALVLGPLPLLVGISGGTEDVTAWTIRGAAFVVVGAVSGALFDRCRLSLTRWQAAALDVAEQQRVGMVALARGAEAKDTDTGDHIVRVQLASIVLAEATGVSEEAAAAIGWSAMLHDVGKLHVPDAILLKPGPLTSDEWDLMRQHTLFGEQILRDGAAFEMARRIARWHHENIDGSGYLDGLRGEQIPFEARIVRVADAFDAMTHDRPYKQAMGLDAALAELQRCAGSQFDPELVRLFVQLVERDATLVARLATHRI